MGNTPFGNKRNQSLAMPDPDRNAGKQVHVHVDVVRSDDTVVFAYSLFEAYVTVGTVVSYVSQDYRGRLETNEGVLLLDNAMRLPPDFYKYRLSHSCEAQLQDRDIEHQTKLANLAEAVAKAKYMDLKVEKMGLELNKIVKKKALLDDANAALLDNAPSPRPQARSKKSVTVEEGRIMVAPLVSREEEALNSPPSALEEIAARFSIEGEPSSSTRPSMGSNATVATDSSSADELSDDDCAEH